MDHQIFFYRFRPVLTPEHIRIIFQKKGNKVLNVTKNEIPMKYRIFMPRFVRIAAERKFQKKTDIQFFQL